MIGNNHYKTAFINRLTALRSFPLRHAATICLTLYSAALFAQVPVRDSSVPSPINASAPITPQANTPSIFEIQTLQQEISELRGQLEEQAYEIKRLKQQRLDDYLDLDKRLSELNQRMSANSTSLPAPAGTPTRAAASNTVSALTQDASVNTEQSSALYNEAIDLLLNKQDYTASQSKFDDYIKRFPKGEFIPNVLYWKGQIFFANGKKADAEKLYKQLIEEYPQHSKIPDAKFKLARLYFEQGKKQEAKVILDEVAASDSDTALLAKSFLSVNYP